MTMVVLLVFLSLTLVTYGVVMSLAIREIYLAGKLLAEDETEEEDT